ncbi:hypothetical protein C0J50_13296 [Silurus asotus]|uniref:Uncharacterized protein n=1 Tax=Silurus asotus TaxID=30991 RepID=A0AAD5B1F5_SILAS|nr:hypothetical protein C0J50_13296 [Silurus asotus]
MTNVISLKNNLTEKTLQKKVKNVFMDKLYNTEMLCKAGKVLSAYQASDLGLKSDREWRLPRQLRAYSKQKNCPDTDEMELVPLYQFLDKILSCAQKEYANGK